ncbi:tetratricopeptide repeat protein [Kitasatospora sp. NPDC002227]|uniref:tetratricopeptide repeat protein n=1 Tax=Kitasatospora sp. NPDC002227 TaxID=3154773 RepID=UPI0033268D8A
MKGSTVTGTSTASTPQHLWLRSADPAGRRTASAALEVPAVLAEVSAHRRLRGPYTAAGHLLLEIVPDALVRCPDSVARHDVELLSVSPELRAIVPASRETLTSLAVPAERTRFYSRLRTLRIAHGLTEFLTDYLKALGDGPRTLVVHDLHHGDPTDRELIAVLLRRMDPAVLTLVVTTGTAQVGEPDTPVAVPLSEALEVHCRRLDHGGEPAPLPPAIGRLFVEEDGTSDDPRVLAAYRSLPPEERALLHDTRRQVLELRGEPSLALGAIAWHAEHGSDPSGAGRKALAHALNHCMDLGFYHAVVDYGLRGRALTAFADDPDAWWVFSTKTTTSYAALGVPERALPIYAEARAASDNPAFHMQAAYATAMLYTRHLDEDHRDHVLARGWINQAIAFARLHSAPKERAMQTAFNRNGLALIEVHDKRPLEALKLLDESMALLDETLDPGEQGLHRSVLRYNRAQVYNSLGRYEEALADYGSVIELDPNYAEYWFDRGAIRRKADQLDLALADFEQAIRLSPPFPEAYYNRADVRAALGDLAGAVADYGYVLELEPKFTDAYLNRASLLWDLGDQAGAWRDVETGLRIEPENSQLLCLKGQLSAEEEDFEAAGLALSAALESDPANAEAWALRGGLAHQQGELAKALADLEQARTHSADPGIAFNLAVARHDSGHLAEALELLDEVVEETGDEDARLRRAQVLIALGRGADALADLQACVEAGQDPERGVDPDLATEAAALLATLPER